MPEGTKFRTSLPGWPTTAGLRLRPGKSWVCRWPILRYRYIWFDDAEWDKNFAVGARDTEVVRQHLNQEARAKIKFWSDNRALCLFGFPTRGGPLGSRAPTQRMLCSTPTSMQAATYS